MVKHGAGFLRAATVTVALAASARSAADEVALDVVFADTFESATPSVYRIGAIALRDPHVFYLVSGFLCLDGTQVLNQQIQDGLDADQDDDGFYDASPLVEFRPEDMSGTPHRFETRAGACTTDATPDCTPADDAVATRWYAGFDVSPPTVCLGALPDTTSGFQPPVPAPDGTCFTTSAIDASLPLDTLTLPLWDTQLAAPWPAAGGSTGGGLLRGFLRESDADDLVVSLGTASVTLSSLLPDGSGSCMTGVAHGKDVDRGEAGWWMYLEYRLDAVSAPSSGVPSGVR